MATFYSKEENRAALRNAMRREKTVDLLLARAQVEESPEPESGAAGADQGTGSGVETGNPAEPSETE